MVKDQNRSVSSHLPGLWKDKNAGAIIIVIVRRTHTWVTSFASYSNRYRHLTNDQKRREYFNLDRVNKEILLKTATGNFFAHISSSSSELLRHLWEALCLWVIAGKIHLWSPHRVKFYIGKTSSSQYLLFLLDSDHHLLHPVFCKNCGAIFPRWVRLASYQACKVTKDGPWWGKHKFIDHEHLTIQSLDAHFFWKLLGLLLSTDSMITLAHSW